MPDSTISTIANPQSSPAPLSKGDVAVKILSANGDLQSVRRPTQVTGIVSNVSSNGTATIKTSQGSIDVSTRGRGGDLQNGQAVQVDLSPGQPPRQGVVRADPNAGSTQQDVSSSQAEATAPVQSSSAGSSAQVTENSASENVPQGAAQSQAASSAQQGSALPQQALPATARATIAEAAQSAINQVTVPTVQTAPLPENAIVRLVPVSALPENALLPAQAPVPSSLPQTGLQQPGLPVAGQSGATAALQTPIAIKPGITASPLQTLLASLAKIEIGPSLLPQAVQKILQPLFHQNFPVQASFTDGAGKPGAATNLISTLQSLAKGSEQNGELTGHVAAPSQNLFSAPLGGQRFDARVISFGTNSAVRFMGAEASGEKPDPFTALLSPLATFPESPETLTADVVGITRQKLPLLSITMPGIEEPEHFIMQFPASNLPVGSRLQLQPLVNTQLQETAGSAGPTSAFDLLSGWTWPNFEDALQVINQAGLPQQFAQSLVNIIPSPANPTQVPPAILFIMAAAGAGDMAGWMGERSISALRSSSKGGDILGRLSNDFDGMSHLSDAPVAQDWKGMPLPLFCQGEIQKAHLFYRHQGGGRDDKNEDQGERSTRFIFDLHMNQIGDVQLDGLMKKKRLDLILRTTRHFSSAMQAKMRHRYGEVLESGGLSGELAFQNRMDQWVKVDVRPSGLKQSV